jgi:peptidoglycan biosynthesis protein MviN/MurJ (putative lipid II flippase)
VFAAALNGVLAAFLTADRRYALATLRVPLAVAVALVFVACVLPAWRSTTALALGVTVGQLVTLAFLWTRAHSVPSEGERAVIPATVLLGSAAAIFAATLVGGQLVVLAERFLATGLAAGAVALLAFARGVALLPVMAAQAIGSGIFPAVTERFKERERASLTRLALTGVRLSLLAALVSTAYVAICRRELVQIAFQRHEFSVGDANQTATLVGILVAALAGVSVAATASKALFALDRRHEVLLLSTFAVGIYVVAAVVLREVYGLDGIAAGFAVSSLVAGIAFAVALARALELSLDVVLREWVLAPLILAGAFTAAALAVWFPVHADEPALGRAIATAVAAGIAGLAALAVAVRASSGVEYLLLSRAAGRLGAYLRPPPPPKGST